ncbi:MAG: glucose-6-phosphate isomerase, partial [Casimicrobiaceae bacterium]
MHADIDLQSPDLHGAARRLKSANLADLFVRDADRAGALAFEWNAWHVDISKERLDAPALAHLLAHAAQANLAHWIAALFAGEKLNLSEQRPALHPALRAPDADSVIVDGIDVMAEIRATRWRMAAFAAAMRDRRR